MRRGRVIRYDTAKHEWTPLPGALSADGLNYSPDGKKLAFVSYPEGDLWVSNSDGGERKQITNAPLRVLFPEFAPDSRRIVFMGRLPGEPWHLYLYPGQSQPVRRLVPGNAAEGAGTWSPDGLRIAYAPVPWDVSPVGRQIFIYDLRTSAVTPVPNSEGLYSPKWSPDGSTIAAIRYQRYGMNPAVLLDLHSMQRTELNIWGSYPNWSKDSKYLYLLVKVPLSSARIVRIRLENREREQLAEFDGRIVANSVLPSEEFIWAGLDRDEHPLVLEDLGSREVYQVSLGSKP